MYVYFTRSPHCDGSCDNSMHVSTGRVATAVLYCKVRVKCSEVLAAECRFCFCSWPFMFPSCTMQFVHTNH